MVFQHIPEKRKYLPYSKLNLSVVDSNTTLTVEVEITCDRQTAEKKVVVPVI
jgi:hypothetical protein